MAMFSARQIFRNVPIFSDTVLISSRSLLGFTRNNNTVADEKKDNPPVPEVEVKPNEELEKLNSEIATMTEKNTELLDKYKRALADGENLRNRLTKQISEAKQYGIQGFCKDLLDVADVLNRATESVPKEEINDNNPHLKNLYEGLKMTEAQLQAVFKRHGLEKVDPLNEKFNPNFHEGLFEQKVEGKDAGIVIVVSKIGYKLHERVVRPALVGVSK